MGEKQEISDTSDWVEGIDGDFRLHNAVVRAMPKGVKVTSARRFGDSAWTKTAKIEVTLADRSLKRYFLKAAFGPWARAVCEGEFVSATLIRDVVPRMCPEPYAWGSYLDESAVNPDTQVERNSDEEEDSDSDSGSDPGSDWTSIASSDDSDSDSVKSDDSESESDSGNDNGSSKKKKTEEDKKTYFFLGEFRDMEFESLPDPEKLLSMCAQMHAKGSSPNGMFGFPDPTVCGRMQRTVTWEKSWAVSFTHQLRDVIRYDKAMHGEWREFALVCEEIINVVVPRLLGVLQSEGRELKPALIHGDFWEKNIALDRHTKEIIVFDPGCVYGHNEMEFGTCKFFPDRWYSQLTPSAGRSQWATHFVTKPEYKAAYNRLIQPSEPRDEYNDRLRLYIVRSHINGSAGDFGTDLRQLAYNDMLFLCEKYGKVPVEDRYDPRKDLQVTGAYKTFDPTITR